ncbi:MAG: cytochrome c maturation protein CcmE [Dehalococcoidia bacterium]|nr:cytochrome c maturation protein CcmE [Dehalococcoidia bacterium]
MSQTLAPLPETQPSDEGILSSHRVKMLIAFAVLVGALGYFVFQAFSGAAVYYYTVGEINDIGPSPEGKTVRVSGKLEPESFHRAAGSTLSEFRLTDGSETLAAAHEGVLPDLFFNEHSEIILEGSYDPNGVFKSENIIVKCPSKYVAAEGDTG